MSPAHRRLAVRQIAFMLRALHQTQCPVGLDDLGAPQLLKGGQGYEPTAPLLVGLERAVRDMRAAMERGIAQRPRGSAA